MNKKFNALSNLDRWQVLFNPIARTIDIKFLGTTRGKYKQDGVITNDGSTTFTSAIYAFQTSGVIIGDIITVASGDNIKRYTVASIESESSLTLMADSTTIESETDLTFRINDNIPQFPLFTVDDDMLQCIYSFAKEEWIELSVPGMIDLICFEFPFIYNDDLEQLEFKDMNGTNWNWANVDTHNMICGDQMWKAIRQEIWGSKKVSEKDVKVNV